MQEFLNSAGIVDDGAALASRLRQDGYLCIKGLLPREDVLGVRAKFLEAVAAAGWLEPGRRLARRSPIRPRPASIRKRRSSPCCASSIAARTAMR